MPRRTTRSRTASSWPTTRAARSARCSAKTRRGAGRRLRGRKARRLAPPATTRTELGGQGSLMRAATRATVGEERREGWREGARGVDVVEGAGRGKKVAQLKPVGVVKG